MLEVIVQTIFLALYLIFRIIGLWNLGSMSSTFSLVLLQTFSLCRLACQILTAKAILGIGLIYYYYRILFIFLPISPKLGPMMIRLRCMVCFAKMIDHMCRTICLLTLVIVDHG